VETGLAEQEQSLLPLIQSTVIGVFQRFSAMTVFDRQNLENILSEQRLALSGDFSDDDFISIGRLTNARLVVFGSITALAGNYFLELAVTDVETGERRASYPPTQISLLALRDLSAIRHASADLLAQLGVNLTESAAQELLRDEDSARIQAENALAMGIAAQRHGTGVEAIAYFFQAAALDPAMREALSRASVVSANVAAGTMLAGIQNRMQEYRDWHAVLEAASIFYSTNLPYELLYDVRIRNEGINFARGTADFSIAVSLQPRAEAWQTISDLRQGFQRAARGEWDHIPSRTREIVVPADVRISVEMELVNENGMVLSGIAYTFSAPSILRRTNREFLFRNVSTDDMGTGDLTVRVASVNGVPAEQAGETGLMQISTANLWDALERERFGAAFSARWRELRSQGRNGVEIGSGALWMLDHEVYHSFAFTAGIYFSPIPFTTLGVEGRFGTSSDRSYFRSGTNSDGDEVTNFRWSGDFYGTGAPLVGLVLPLGQWARIFTAGLIEMGTFGMWTGAWADWASPGIKAGIELGSEFSFSVVYRGTFFNEGYAHGFNIGIGMRF